MAKSTRLDLFIRPNSDTTKQGAVDYAYTWANDRTSHETNFDENGNEINAYYVDITDSRNGQKFMVFGDLAQSIIGVPKLLEILNKEEFASKEVEDTVAVHEQDIEELKTAETNTQAVII